MNKLCFFSVVLLMAFSCSGSKKTAVSSSPASDILPIENSQTIRAPHVLLYKTRTDYIKNVPVSLTEDKKGIASFPAPEDLFKGNSLNYPMVPENGYLLNNTGISKNTAFLTLTYEEYSKLKVVPATEELMKLILDDDPFTELWDCGIRDFGKSLPSEINELITNHKLNLICKRLK